MLIDKLMVDPGASIFYTASFRNVLEEHLEYLRTHESTRVMTIEPAKAYRFEGDFFGLLAHYSVAAYLHWVTLRLNGFTTPTQAHPEISTILVPDEATINRIRQSHMTSRRISQ